MMSPYKYIEVENQPNECPTCGSDLILVTGKDNPIYICGECGQPLYQHTEEGEEAKNANCVFAHFEFEAAFCFYPRVHVHVSYNKVTSEVAIYGDFSTQPNDGEGDLHITGRSIRVALSDESIEDFMTTDEDKREAWVLDGNSYKLTIWADGRKRTILADDGNVNLFPQFKPFAKYAQKFYEENHKNFYPKHWRNKSVD